MIICFHNLLKNQNHIFIFLYVYVYECIYTHLIPTYEQKYIIFFNSCVYRYIIIIIDFTFKTYFPKNLTVFTGKKHVTIYLSAAL